MSLLTNKGLLQKYINPLNLFKKQDGNMFTNESQLGIYVVLNGLHIAAEDGSPLLTEGSDNITAQGV